MCVFCKKIFFSTTLMRSPTKSVLNAQPFVIQIVKLANQLFYVRNAAYYSPKYITFFLFLQTWRFFCTLFSSFAGDLLLLQNKVKKQQKHYEYGENKSTYHW